MLTPEIIEARRKLVAKNERELSKQPPRPLQPGDKVLVEAKYRQPFMGHGEVLFHLPDGNHACIVVQQSSIRPFPQEEE